MQISIPKIVKVVKTDDLDSESQAVPSATRFPETYAPRSIQCAPMRASSSASTWWIAIFAFAAIMGITMMNYGGAQDNDMWWLFATGREIVHNGIPHMNPFSVWDDQTMVVQQWIPAVIDYLVYSAFGFTGVGVMVALLSLIMVAVAYALARTFTHGKGSELSFVAIALLMGCASAYLSIRPQVWSMIAYMCVLMVMERYRAGADKAILTWLPVIMVVHVNMHMSLALFDLVIIAAYLLPDVSKKNIREAFRSYSRLWIFVALAACAVAACANPYGIDGAAYLLNSYSSAGYGDYISEMKPITIVGKYYGWCMVAFVALGGMAIGKCGRSRCDLPLVALYVLTLVMSFHYVRNVWLVAIFSFALISYAYADTAFDTKVVILRDDPPKLAIASIVCATVCILGVFSMTAELNEQPTDSMTTPVVAVDYLADHTQQGDETRVFTHFNAGGFLEWNGYKVSMDARPELWDNAISKNGEDRYREYIDMTQGNISCGEYMTGKVFDYMIVNTDTDLYDYISNSLDYEIAAEGNGYVLFKQKRSNVLNAQNVVETSS